MVKSTLLIISVMCTLSAYTQVDFKKDKQLQASLTFSIGQMRDNVTNAYLHGFINYFPEEKISLRGDGYYFFNSISESKPLALNHQVFAGGLYHFSSEKIIPYIGFQPGLALGSRSDSVFNENAEMVSPQTVFTPLGSGVVGFNYFGGKHFSLFAEVRLVRGLMLSNAWPKYLDEIRVSFGLAFQINTKREVAPVRATQTPF